MRKAVLALSVFVVWLCSCTHAFAQVQNSATWHYHASLYLYTNAAGANLPASARLEGFPLLVRLSSDTFDFRTAKPHGEDLRFTDSSGANLAYNIDSWNPAVGQACIWVRIPVIRGAEVQQIRMHWGNAGATAESNGAAVFSTTNGYAAVLHMGDGVKDEVGSVNAEMRGVTASAGVIGDACHFAGGQGIFCGEQIVSLPSGNASHSTGCWFRAAQSNSTIIGWGNEGGGRGSKIRMQLRSPAHVHIDSDFSDVNGNVKIPVNEWVYVQHTYSNGTGRIYINGKLDSEEHPHLNIHTPERMWVGGWYNNYDFQGDIDEVRLSTVERSADWIWLEYENQKPLQTLVGLPVQDAAAEVMPRLSATEIHLKENEQAKIAVLCPGAQKIAAYLAGPDQVFYPISVNQKQLTLDAGRVSADTNRTLKVEVQMPSGTRVLQASILIKRSIPDPEFTLVAPKVWDGRVPITVKAVLKNESVFQTQHLKVITQWTAAGIAAATLPTAAGLRLSRAHNSGQLAITAAISNGGEAIRRSITIQVHEPQNSEPIKQDTGDDETPQTGQFYATSHSRIGYVRWQGPVTALLAANPTAKAYYLKADSDRIHVRYAYPLAGIKRFAVSIPIIAGLHTYTAEWGVEVGGKSIPLGHADDLICGDAYLIDGQSNAEATAWGSEPITYTSPWIRTYGATSGLPGGRLNAWGVAVARADGGKFQIGAWGMELARRIVEEQHIPVCILNGAVGGTRIDQHQRDETNPENGESIYGRLLWRVRQAHLQTGIKAIYWHQGENDQGADGPTGGYGWETYKELFIKMASDWYRDYPNLHHIYLFQIWPKSCAMGINGSDNRLREVQRTLPQLFSHASIMSTLGIDPPGGCHYPPAGYAEMARLIFGQTQEFTYARRGALPASPPNLLRAWVQQDKPNVIHLKFNQPVIWSADLCSEFLPDGQPGRVTSGKTLGNELELTLTQADGAPHKLTYLDSANWSQKRLLKGQNGIAALTFCDVPVEQAMTKGAAVKR